MEPTFLDQTIVWVFHWAYFFSPTKRGDVVVFKKEGQDWVKRISKTLDDSVWVEGDNPEDSQDSRKFGPINKKQIIGKILFIQTKRGQ